jgi:hypothetical protein
MDARTSPDDDTTRILILADEEGTILGAFGHILSEGENPPEWVEIIPMEGQVVREVEVPLELLRMDPEDDVFARYRLEFDEEGGRLIDR